MQQSDVLKKAKRRRSILRLVRQDLVEVWLEIRSESELETLPLIAVDWSELFAYSTAAPPSRTASSFEGGSGELWSSHYAALTFLFYKLPCRLLLLPPYVWEMRNFLDLLKQGVFTEQLAERTPFPTQKYKHLLAELRSLKERNEEFSGFIDAAGDSCDLSEELLGLVTEIAYEYIPSLFLQLQESTMRFLESLHGILYGRESQRRRILTLEEVDGELAASIGMQTEHWLYWLHYMNNERDRPRQNKADALALAYLEQLHQRLYLKGRPLFFATRSRAMFVAMSYHPGSFPPGLSSYLGAGHNSFSSARSWEYFAEVGYYMDNERGAGNLPDLDKRIALLDVQIESIERQGDVPVELVEDHRDLAIRWESIRGTYDLDGLGDRENWQKLRTSDERLLINLLKMLLSPERSQALVSSREKLAGDILDRVDRILTRFPVSTLADESILDIDVSLEKDVPRQYSPVQVLQYLNLAKELSKILSPPSEAKVTRLIDMIGNDQQVRSAAMDILSEASGSSGLSTAETLWLAAASYYALRNFKDASYFFTNWSLIRAGKVSAGPALITAGLNAECLKKRDKLRRAFLALERPGFTGARQRIIYMAIWHNLKARYVIEWIEPRGEEYDNFPYDSNGSITERTFKNMYDWALSNDRLSRIRNSDLRFFTINNLLYGGAKCLRHDETPAQWMIDRMSVILRLADELADACERENGPQYTHTLGYLFLKLSVVKPLDRDLNLFRRSERVPGKFRQKALEFLERAMAHGRDRDLLANRLARFHLRILRDRQGGIVQ